MFKIEVGAKRNGLLRFIHFLVHRIKANIPISIFILLILFLPMVFIWCLNTLFNLHIINNMVTKEWLASLLILGMFAQNIHPNNSK